MQINRDFTIQKVGSAYVAVPVGETSRHFHGMVRLNATGAFVWNLMAEKDCTEEELVQALLDAYEVEREVVEADVRRVVQLLQENGILV